MKVGMEAPICLIWEEKMTESIQSWI